jgi:hypothetical protein
VWIPGCQLRSVSVAKTLSGSTYGSPFHWLSRPENFDDIVKNVFVIFGSYEASMVFGHFSLPYFAAMTGHPVPKLYVQNRWRWYNYTPVRPP